MKRKRFPERVAQKVMYDLLSVVSYLHLRGIVHNDLKPENIMMASDTDDSEIIIGDFGLSKFAMDEERFTMAQGTLAYVSPEVLNGTGYGKEVDLWSCGVILYLLVSGTLPFDSNEREVIIEKTMEGRVPLDRKSFAEVSDECKSLIKGLLTVDVERRFTCQQALSHPWFRLRWNEHGERLKDSSSAAVTAPSSTLSSAPPSPALTGLPSTLHHHHHAGAALTAPPHLFFTRSSATGGMEVDSSNDGGEGGGADEEEDDDDEEEEEEEDSESTGKDEAATAGKAEDGSGFRKRFINLDDSPSHSR